MTMLLRVEYASDTCDLHIVTAGILSVSVELLVDLVVVESLI